MKAIYLFVGTISVIIPLNGKLIAVTIETVPVGNPGNAADDMGFGSVGHEFFMAKYEVTNSQYPEFLNFVDPGGSDPLDLYAVDPRGLGITGIMFSSGASNGTKYAAQAASKTNPSPRSIGMMRFRLRIGCTMDKATVIPSQARIHS